MESHSRIEVLTAILLLARDGATRTSIIWESALGRSQVEECLGFLQRSGFLLKEEHGCYRPTKKGVDLIADYERISRAVL